MIVVCGDAVIDFLPVPTSANAWAPAKASGAARTSFVASPGGSCRNIASGLGRLGAAAGFMGGLSTDFFGDLLANSLQAGGVSLHYAARLPEPSTLGFVTIGDGEPAYAFYDQFSAHRSWTRSASPPLDDRVTALHVGSLTLIEAPVADEMLALLREQKGRRVLSIDPNCRPSLTGDLPAYRTRLDAMFALADIIKLSVSDLEFLHPGADAGGMARGWIARGTRLVILTRGAQGATAWTRDGDVTVPAGSIRVVDTVGAGDSFIAACLFQLDDMGVLGVATLGRLGLAELRLVLEFAAKVSAITCSRPGADPPTRAEVDQATALPRDPTSAFGH